MLAWIQGLILLALVPLAGIHPSLGGLLGTGVAIFLVSVTFTLLGFLIAWQMESSQGFHAVMNLALFPLWMISGAIFPAANAHGWMRMAMAVNPLTYSLALLRRLLDPASAAGSPGLGLSLLVTVLCALALLVASTAVANRKSAGSKA